MEHKNGALYFTDEEKREHEAQRDAREERRIENEAALNDVSAYPPALVVKVASVVINALSGLLPDGNYDEYIVAMREAAETLGVPFVELNMAAQRAVSNPDMERDDLGAWVAWCQQYAPERLSGKAVG